METGYEKLEIFQMSKELAIRIHRMTLTLPKFETYEEGSQIRRSSKSIGANIVEGYCLRRHKNEYLQYLHRALGSSQETIFHLKMLRETNSLSDQKTFEELVELSDHLGKKIFRFIEAVSSEHLTPAYVKEEDSHYDHF